MSVRYSVDPFVRVFSSLVSFITGFFCSVRTIHMLLLQKAFPFPQKVLVFQVVFPLVNSFMKFHFSALALPFAKLFEKCFLMN